MESCLDQRLPFLFYLPIIIFEAMFKANENAQKAGEVEGD
jgi:hypothetical protein